MDAGKNGSSVWTSYRSRLIQALEQLDSRPLDGILAALRQARKDGRMVFFAGNGGSAATANHFACDMSKSTADADDRLLRCLSLVASMPAVMAYANDTGYENSILGALRSLFQQGDVLIAISTSGNSPNVVKAAEFVRDSGGTVIALTGFTGGRLRELADIAAHVPSDECEVAEDAHCMILHALICELKKPQHG